MRRNRRIPLAREDYYSRHPLRVAEALERAELDFYGYALVSLFVDKIDSKILAGGAREVAFTLDAFAETLGWPLGRESLRQKLHELRREGWIDFDDLKRGQRKPWIFRLGTAAIDGETNRPPMGLQVETPSELEVSSNERKSEEPANPQPERVSDEPQPPSVEGPRAELSGAERKAGNEESLDHAEGLTRKGQLEETKNRIAAVESSRRREAPLNGLHSKIDRAKAAAEKLNKPEAVVVRIVPESAEAEAALLAEAEQLVAEGIAEWVEEVGR